MSQNNVVENNGQQAHITTDLTKIFLWKNKYDVGNLTNSGYTPKTYIAGTALGRVGATQELTPQASGAIDGSQYPVGVLAQDITIEDGETKQVTFCKEGDVAREKIILDGVDTLATLLADNRSIGDHIESDSVGIRLVGSTQLTATDNE